MSEATLALTVRDFVRSMQDLVPAAKTVTDWTPLAEFVTVENFERVGVFMEVQDWQQYTEMLTLWATSVDRFETKVRRVAETGDVVYFEVEERHVRGDDINVVNSMTVFEFDADGKIRHLDVYLQQHR